VLVGLRTFQGRIFVVDVVVWVALGVYDISCTLCSVIFSKLELRDKILNSNFSMKANLGCL